MLKLERDESVIRTRLTSNGGSVGMSGSGASRIGSGCVTAGCEAVVAVTKFVTIEGVGTTGRAVLLTEAELVVEIEARGKEGMGGS